jgi:chemotaxis methyl-accepting protein methylase|tara:strand:+ start:95 stop:313 length:219 start_codon:yes stop_codon:yes gene_type:complete
MDFVVLLDKHNIGNEETIEANRIIEELTYVLKNPELVDTIETQIVEEEHKQMSQDIADEILSHGCPNGNCDV